MIVISNRSTPERRWLAHLFRASAGAIRAGDRFDDDLPFRPRRVAALAHRHGVAPLLHTGFARGRIGDPLPRAFREECRAAHDAAVRETRLALEIGSAVLDHLADAGIAVAPVEGHGLLMGPAAVYDGPGTRPMGAVHLIVGRDDLHRVAQELRTLGFEPVAAGRRSPLAGAGEIGLRRTLGADGISLVLHWAWAGFESALRDSDASGERFLRDLCERTPEGRFVPTRVGHLLFVASHAARHAFQRWVWLLDLHRLVEVAPLDWAELAESARKLRVRRPLYAGLTAARELLRSPVPKEVRAALAPGLLRRRLLHRALAASVASAAPRRSDRVAALLLEESWWDVARTAAWAAAPGLAGSRPWRNTLDRAGPPRASARSPDSREPGGPAPRALETVGHLGGRPGIGS